MQPTPPTAPEAPPPTDVSGPPHPHGEVTRHLVAAVHLEPELANRVIHNYVTAPWEALPPSPGVDAGTILTQALIARHRRRVRDALVLALMLVAALAVLPYSISFAFLWAGLWLAWSVVAFLRQTPTERGRKLRDDETRTSFGGVAATVLFLCWLVVSLLAAGSLFSLLDSGSSYGYDEGFSPLVLVPALIFLLSAAAIYLVLLVDKMVVRHLLVTHGGCVPPPLVGRLTGWLTAATTRKHGTLLNEVTSRSAPGNVLVHGGWNAFVGHGNRINAWTIPLVLRARDRAADEVTPLRPLDLYEAVNTELCTMREADLLAPGQRLRDLTVTPLIVASNKGLRLHGNSPLGRELLPETNGRPANTLRTETLQSLMDQDQEWVRHFQRSSVTSWNSDLLVSTFLNVGCDNRTLYLEWNAYCLFPIAPEHRKGGYFGTSPSRVTGLATLDFLQLLGSIARRWRTLWEMTEGVRTSSSWTVPDDPESDHNTIESIREVAADTRCDSEFQDLDGQRHIKLLEERMFSAVRHHLRERGYDTEGLDQQSTQIINNTNNNFGSSQFVGAQNFGDGGAATVSTGRNSREDS